MTEDFSCANPARFHAALRRLDEENARDPNFESVNGVRHPHERIYAQWLTGWVLKLCPGASEELRLAARSQHICRWMIPRSSFPQTRPGYLQWRQKLKEFHAEKSGAILREIGYPEHTIRRVQQLNLKKCPPDDPEGQALEDALCLVFLERQLTDLTARNSEEKVINALKKSWQKMSPAARAEALKLPYTPVTKALLNRALAQAV